MNFPNAHRKQFPRFLTLLTLCLFLIPLSLNSCSTSSYDSPVTSQTTSVLIQPETLKAWIDSGIVNSTGYDRVVVLDVNSQANYNAGHIPGAQFLSSGDLYQIRKEGPATDVNMVIDGAHMDALIQRYGIDQNSTIVFTAGTSTPSAGNVLNASRAYWTFRYWGFPKEKLKVLDGINAAWAAVYSLTTSPSPATATSTYSVKNNAGFRADLRASLADMISVAEGRVPGAIPVDMRSSETDGSYIGKRGSTAGVFTPGTDWVAFEGRVKGGRALLYTTLLDSANSYRFKTAADLAALFAPTGIDGTNTAYVY